MKAILSAIAVVSSLLIGVLSATPARAQPLMDTCQHAATIASLRACVQHATDQGVIDNQGIARGLLATLDAAQVAVDRGQPGVAVNILAAFVRQVDAQAGKHIAEPHADHLVMHAQLVIAALQQ